MIVDRKQFAEDVRVLKGHTVEAQRIIEQAAADRRSGFIAGRYEARFFPDREAWGVQRFTDDGIAISGAMGPFTSREAQRKASELNARSAALLNHADEH